MRWCGTQSGTRNMVVLKWYCVELMTQGGMSSDRDPTGALVLVERRGGPVYEAKWRRAGRQVKRRVGPAWLERTADREGWGPRRGRLPVGYFDEKRATVRMAEMIGRSGRSRRGSASAGNGERASARSLASGLSSWRASGE